MAKTKISEFNANPALNTDIDSINIAEGCSPSGINDAIRELMSQLKDWQSGTSNDPYVVGSSGSLTLNQGTANGVAYLNGSKVVTSGSALTFDGTTLTTSGLVTTADASALTTFGRFSSGYAWSLIRPSSTSTGFEFRTFVGDALYQLDQSSGANKHIWYTGGTEGMRLTSGNLGIGTSSPQQKFVVSNGGAAGVEVSPNGGSQGGTYIQSYNRSGTAFVATELIASKIGFYTGTSPTFSALLDSSGNLGLGVTPSAWSGLRGLQNGLANIVGYVSNAQGGWFTSNAYYNGGWKYQSTAQATSYEQLSGVHAWHIAPSGTAGNAITFTQAMTLDASGNLGVGTTSPVSTLDVRGNVYVQVNTNQTNSLAVQLTNQTVTSNNGCRLSFDAYNIGSSALGLPTDSASLAFYTGGVTTERARIDSSGNLLVGTTSLGGAAGFGVSPNASVGAAALYWNRSTSTSTSYVQDFRNAGSTVGYIAYNNTSVTYSTSSDYRLKNTIAPMTGALAKVALLKPVTYKWNSDGSDGEGFIAHELAEVVPQCVTGEKDAVDEEGNPKYQGIDTSFLVATLTAAIQELNAKFEAYKASHP